MTYRIINVLALCGVIYVNYLANALPINGKTTGELSNQYANLFVPAGLTFAIWGLIYLLLMIFSVIQFLPPYKESSVTANLLFTVSCLFNMAWIVAWHYERMGISILIMLGLLATLALINRQLASENQLLLKAVFGIYLGWILIATIANLTTGLVSVNWTGWGISPVSWTLILIAAGVVVASFNMVKLDNPFLAVAVAWAFLGISIKRAGDQPVIARVAEVAMVAVLVTTAIVIYRMWKLRTS